MRARAAWIVAFWGVATLGCGGAEPVTPAMPGPCGNVSSISMLSVDVEGTTLEEGDGWCVDAAPGDTTLEFLLDDPTFLRLTVGAIDGAGTYTCAFGETNGVRAELRREATFSRPTDVDGAELTFLATTESANRGTTECELTWTGFPEGGGAATGTFTGRLSRWTGAYGGDGQPVREYADVSFSFSVAPFVADAGT